MKLEHTDIIKAPLEKVYQLVKNDLPKIVEYLPNIKEIRVIERQEKEGRDYVVNQWFAEANIPSLAKKFISEELFSWKDAAYWDDQKHRVDYEIEPFFAKGIYEAKGTNLFKDDAGKTQLTLKCEVHIFPDRIPGVPKFIARQIHPILEQTIQKMLEPNLTSLGRGLKEYFRSHV